MIILTSLFSFNNKKLSFNIYILDLLGLKVLYTQYEIQG